VHSLFLGLAIGAVILVLLVWRGLRATRLAAQLRADRETAAATLLAAAQAQALAQRKAQDKQASRAATKAEVQRVIAAEAARVSALRAARNEEAERVAREAALRASADSSEESAGLAARQVLAHAARPASQELEAPVAESEAGSGTVEPAKADAAAATPVETVATKSPAETLILVADDSKVVRLTTGRLLAQHGYRIVYAVDGADGVKQAEAELPDLVVTDIEMPNMDGFGLFRQLRGNARSAHIPVIMISSADDMFREPALREGVSLVLGKPFDAAPLLEHIRSFRFPIAAAVAEPDSNRRDWSQTEAGALA
jgi:PleD family two-component response regulator